MKNPIAKLFTVTALLGAPNVALAYVRTLPSGAPACGNVQGKGDGAMKERACTTAELEEWKAERAAEERAAKLAARGATTQAGRVATPVAPATPARPVAPPPRAAARTTPKATR